MRIDQLKRWLLVSLLMLSVPMAMGQGRRGGTPEVSPPAFPIYRALSDFPDTQAGEVPYYQDSGRQALAIAANIVTYREKFARAVCKFDGPSGVYDVKIATVQEEDGESTYRLLIKGEIVAEFQNPYIGPGSPLNNSVLVHTWKSIAVEEGDEIGVESNTHSNGELPEPGGFAWARGRWRHIEFFNARPLASLAHHWKLDEDSAQGDTIVRDAVGGADGNNVGAMTDIGVSGHALRFDGSPTSHVDVNGVVTDELKNLSVSLWINPDVNTLSTSQIKRVFSGGDNFEVILQGSTGQVANNLYQGGGTYPRSTGPLPEGEWTHVVATSELMPQGSGLMAIYLNGVLDVTMEATADDDWNDGLMKMGHRPGRPDNERFQGALDDIRIYKGILTAAQVPDLMTDFPTLVHHWKLDEGTALAEHVVIDSVGEVDGNNVGAITDVGIHSNALRFDGSASSHVDVNGIVTDDLKNISVTLWINPDADSLTTSPIKRVFSGGDNFELILQGSTGQVANNFYQGGGTYPRSTDPLPGNEWTHVAVTSELMPQGSGLMTIYVDGVLDVVMEATADDDWNEGLMKIGHRPGRPDDERFIGALDDIRIYKGILTAPLVQESIGE